MGKITVFNLVTLDGLFAGPNGEIDWHNADDEFSRFTVEQIQTRPFDTLIFGRVTYELMASYWPTPEAIKNDPIVAGFMNRVPKTVFSRTPHKVEEGSHWKNITILHEIKPEEILKWKEQKGREIGIFGSGTIVQQFANLGLIDEYRLLVNPVILGAGRPLFQGVKKTSLKLLDTRRFGNGNVLLTFEPGRQPKQQGEK